MKLRFLTKAFYSLLLLVILTLTMIVSVPSIATAQDSSNAAHQALQQGLDAEKKGDLTTAKDFYEQAIIEVGRNKDVIVLAIAKNQLADLLENQSGDAAEVKRLREQADAAIKALGDPSGSPSCRNECLKNGKPGEFQFGVCVQCPIGG